MTYQAVIFDFGGVLVRSLDQNGRRLWEERLGLPPGRAAQVVFGSDVARQATCGLAPTEAIWQHVAAQFGLNPVELAQFRTDFWASDRLDATLVTFLRALRPEFKTAILSNAWLNGRRVIGHGYGLAQVVDEIIISAEEGVAKPAAEAYERALRRLDVPAAAAIMVDDFPENIAGAAAAGLTGVHFRNSTQTIADLERLLGRR